MGPTSETAWNADRLWAVALVTVPALVIFADHRWTDIVFMFAAGPSWPVQMALAALVAAALSRLAFSGGGIAVAAALVASQLVAHRHGEHADLAAFLMAAFQVAVTARVVEALRGGWRGAPAGSWAFADVQEQVLCFAAALVLGLVAWRSGLGAWLAGLLGGDDNSLLVALLASFVAGRAAVLLHELGHAVVARRRLGQQVALRVGRRGRPVTVSVGGIEARLHLLDVLQEGGAVELDASRVTAGDMAAIALAGPAASLAGLAAALPLLASMPGDDGLPHALVWWFALLCGVGVLNLLPFRFQLSRGAPAMRSDGRQLLDALAVKAALR